MTRAQLTLEHLTMPGGEITLVQMVDGEMNQTMVVTRQKVMTILVGAMLAAEVDGITTLVVRTKKMPEETTAGEMTPEAEAEAVETVDGEMMTPKKMAMT